MSTSVSRARAIIGIDVVEAVTDAMGSAEERILVAGGQTFTAGSGSGQINAAWSSPARALADGGNETLNLTDASLTTKRGASVDFSAIKTLYVKNNFAAGNLLLGAAASTPVDLFEASAGDRQKIFPGGEMEITFPGSGLDVSTNGSLKITHDGAGDAAGSYDIAIEGVGVYS